MRRGNLHESACVWLLLQGDFLLLKNLWRTGKCVQPYLGGIIIFVTQWVSRQTAVRWRHLSTMQSGQTPAAAAVEEDRNCKLLTAQRTKRLLMYYFMKTNQLSLNSRVSLKVDISGLLFIWFLFSPEMFFKTIKSAGFQNKPCAVWFLNELRSIIWSDQRPQQSEIDSNTSAARSCRSCLGLPVLMLTPTLKPSLFSTSTT